MSSLSLLRRALVRQRIPLNSIRTFKSCAPLRVVNSGSGAASDDIKHAIENAKEEGKTLAGDMASLIAGGRANELASENHKMLGENIAGEITSNMLKSVPKGAMIFGAMGLLPFFATSLSTLLLTRMLSIASQSPASTDAALNLLSDPESLSSLLNTVQTVQLGYGASILTFLGAVHAGFLWSGKYGKETISRYAMTVMPLGVSWVSVVLPWEAGLTVQWAGFLAMWIADVKSSRNGWCPRWYSTFRFYLTSIVGISIIGSLIAFYHYSPQDMKRVEEIWEAKHRDEWIRGTAQGTVTSDVTTVPAPESAGAFNQIVADEHRDEPDTAGEQKAGSEEKKAKQAEKNKAQDENPVRAKSSDQHLGEKKMREEKMREDK